MAVMSGDGQLVQRNRRRCAAAVSPAVPQGGCLVPLRAAHSQRRAARRALRSSGALLYDASAEYAVELQGEPAFVAACLRRLVTGGCAPADQPLGNEALLCGRRSVVVHLRSGAAVVGAARVVCWPGGATVLLLLRATARAAALPVLEAAAAMHKVRVAAPSAAVFELRGPRADSAVASVAADGAMCFGAVGGSVLKLDGDFFAADRDGVLGVAVGADGRWQTNSRQQGWTLLVPPQRCMPVWTRLSRSPGVVVAGAQEWLQAHAD
eukprot:TRINITY_DN21817_c0_g1_i1.p2 TRINITY_DN21817_c0_g1~~TRINITY_DN21817_c0_g1_i1.p2  ORF type:complete len:266 (+),score=68.19 TRINITY_DN21817_c0_g1_i1:361-1158(+)